VNVEDILLEIPERKNTVPSWMWLRSMRLISCIWLLLPRRHVSQMVHRADCTVR
jgi:hypothetical protein